MQDHAEYHADFIAIEKASSGLALLEVLQEHYAPDGKRQILQSISPRHSKEDRMAKAMILVEQGKIFLPADAPWLADLTNELIAFPAGVSDDQVDATSQAIDFFRKLLRTRHNPAFKGGGRVLATW
ncbi:MAG: phage terminase large subunit [Octadecabacter sp.]|nr:phage terminase large subunit [Octadecabacter sp.]